MFVGNVEDEDGADDIPVVVFNDGVVTFLSGGVPYIDFNNGTIGYDGEGVAEFDSDGGIFVGWSIGDACEEGRFPDTSVTNEDDFI